jgi:hypothetical protein
VARRQTIIAALACFAAPAFAWGPTGHRTIGAIATPYLSVQTRAGMQALIGPEGVAEASTWADFMRADPAEFWQKTAGPWHYVTVPDGKSYAQAGAPPQGDAVTALARFAATVRDPAAALADRQLALRFIIHIVGDLHQPLHAGNGQDRGGNDVKVTLQGRETNLHAVWDSGLIDLDPLSYSERARWLAARITPAQAKAWTTADPQVWIAESQAARASTYRANPDLRYEYVFQTKPLLDDRLSQAGVRTAAYLNWLFAGAKDK